MSNKTYKEIIKETITFLGGKATVVEIYDFIEKNYTSFLGEKNEKTWKNNIRYTLSTGPFYQTKDSGASIEGTRFSKHWYNNPDLEKPDPEIIFLEKTEEIIQREFEEALNFIQSNKEYREMMLDYYLEI